MRYNIINRGDPFSITVANDLDVRLKQIDFIHDVEHPEIIFTIGGDGTLLKSVHQYLDQSDEVVFVGIHTGKLGFFTDFLHDDLEPLFESLQTNQFHDVKFPLLEASVCRKNDCLHFYAMNEITLINAYHSQQLDVFINNDYFESFQGTGVCISTPQGSSAYNKSLGGALLHPKIKAFQLTEMGSINSNVYRTISSPMILPQEHELTFISRDFDGVTITIDHMHRNIEEYESIVCRLSDKYVTLRQFHENDFWKRVQKSFL